MKRKSHLLVGIFTDENLQKVIEAMYNGITIRKSCRRYNIPRATLQDRIKARIANKPRQMGPDSYLSAENEKKVVNWIINLAKCGFPVKKRELISTIQKIVLDHK
ncbi:unnamed protein product [Brassicogethes aeneus]|uniref:HTH psq-type domain-containing protein n=1 Tax=Brassicogethes aeneus TaxID=1431903 RepID=A0A9P0AZ80_BRAAE|nr:unnamed protein product [Brassicogethes aeneus]